MSRYTIFHVHFLQTGWNFFHKVDWQHQETSDAVRTAWAALRGVVLSDHFADRAHWLREHKRFDGNGEMAVIDREVIRPWAWWCFEAFTQHGPRLPIGHPELRLTDRSEEEPPRLSEPDGYETSNQYLERVGEIREEERRFLAGKIDWRGDPVGVAI